MMCCFVEAVSNGLEVWEIPCDDFSKFVSRDGIEHVSNVKRYQCSSRSLVLLLWLRFSVLRMLMELHTVLIVTNYILNK